ncbi:MAG: hypothetical protein PHX51_03425 [Clostridia bacterium]|nr:hypothetical protein [Clostridia bacterium]
MKAKELADKLGLKVFCGDCECEITGYYVGDLLSWVMGRADEGNCWITIMNNLNVCAVAKLLSFSCVVLCEKVLPDEKLLEKAKAQNITLLGSDDAVFATCKAICDLNC